MAAGFTDRQTHPLVDCVLFCFAGSADDDDEDDDDDDDASASDAHQHTDNLDSLS